MTYAAPAQSGGGFLPILMIVGLFVLMYFFMIRPQSKRRREMQEMQQTLGAGSQVVTVGGLHGTVVDVSADEGWVELEVAPGVMNRYERSAIAKVLTGGTELDPADVGGEAAGPDLTKR